MNFMHSLANTVPTNPATLPRIPVSTHDPEVAGKSGYKQR